MRESFASPRRLVVVTRTRNAHLSAHTQRATRTPSPDAGSVSAASSGRTDARRLPSRPAYYSGGPWRSLAPQQVQLPVLSRQCECDALQLLRRGFAETGRLQQRARTRFNRHWFLLFRLWVRPPTLANNATPAPTGPWLANHPTTAWTGCTSLSSAATSAPSTLPRPGTKRGHSHTETLPQAPRLLSRRAARFWPGAPPRLRPPS